MKSDMYANESEYFFFVLMHMKSNCGDMLF